MPAGRPRKPTNLHILQGTYQPVRHAERIGEVDPQSVARMPSHLSPIAKREWQRIAPELRELGLLTGLDVAALSAYCECFATVRVATQILETEGLMIEGKPHPVVRVRHEALGYMRQYLREFGLSPSARAGLKRPAEKRAKEETDEDFLFGG